MDYKETHERLKSFARSLPQLKAFRSLTLPVRGPGPAERRHPLLSVCEKDYPLVLASRPLQDQWKHWCLG